MIPKDKLQDILKNKGIVLEKIVTDKERPGSAFVNYLD